MEQKPVNTFVSPEKALNGGGQSPAQELYSFVPSGADRDDVIDRFMNRQVELNDTVEQIDATPGFNLDANGLLDKTSKKTEANDALSAVTDSWQKFGGNEIIEAQAAVDALNFNSTAEDRVNAQNKLRDAKNAFYENYQSAITVETEVEAEPASDESEAAPTETTDTNKTDAEDASFPNIRRPAVLRYEAAQKAEAERDLSTSEPIALPGPDTSTVAESDTQPVTTKLKQKMDGPLPDIFTHPDYDDFVASYRSRSKPTKAPEVPKAAVDPGREAWFKMMSAERKELEDAKIARKRKIGSVASNLLDDSELVQEYRDRRSKRRFKLGRAARSGFFFGRG